ncbi:MAG: HAD family hydrolase [Woeseiaceae bacterium]|nr:HAD family hydrolase [Woeseiaceae bacterium]
MQGIRTITLDLDDTLWPISPVIIRAEQGLYEWLQEHYPRITSRYSGRDLLQQRLDVAAEFPDKSHDFTFMRREVLARVAEAVGYGTDYVDDAMEVFMAHRNDVEMFPEVRPALEQLGRRYRVVAVTNGNASLERIGIRELFDGVVSASTAGAAKPAQRIFDAAVEIGGADAHETLHVGDHPECDVDGANNAGLRTAWVNRAGAEWPDHLQRPDVIVRDIGELLALLGKDH